MFPNLKLKMPFLGVMLIPLLLNMSLLLLELPNKPLPNGVEFAASFELFPNELLEPPPNGEEFVFPPPKGFEFELPPPNGEALLLLFPKDIALGFALSKGLELLYETLLPPNGFELPDPNALLLLFPKGFDPPELPWLELDREPNGELY